MRERESESKIYDSVDEDDCSEGDNARDARRRRQDPTTHEKKKKNGKRFHFLFCDV